MRFPLRQVASLVIAADASLAMFAADQKAEMLVQLPPFIVETPRGPAWRYMEIPHYEILSRCNPIATENLARAFHRATLLLNTVVPPRFQLAFDAPQTLIFYDEKLWPAAEREAIAALFRAPVDGAPPGVHLPSLELPAVRPKSGSDPADIFINNLMLSDADAHTTFVLVSPRSIDPRATNLTPAYVGSQLRGRTPTLPDWFLSTFLRLYQRMKFRDNSVHLPVSRSAILLPTKPKAPPQLALLPWPVFFDSRLQEGEFDLTRWLDQADLFVTWGIDPANGSGSAFWKFLDRACNEPVTESLFRECFGTGFDYTNRRLADYALKAGDVQWELPDQLAELPAGPIRDATPGEVARMMGEWERLEMRYVAANQPDLSGYYLDLARTTLLKAYDRGDRDPRLVAVLGLLELEADNKPLAREYLESVAQAPALRSRARFELARLRYDAAFGRSKRNDGKLTAEQTNAIIAPLLAASRQNPPSSPVYELMAHVYFNSTEAPSTEVLATIDAGARLFPENTPLLLTIAELHARRGDADQARELTTLGLLRATKDSMRAELLELNKNLLRSR